MKGHLRARGKGSWAIVIELDRDTDGRRRQRWQTVHGTKRDAERELARLLHERQTDSYIEPARMTVADYLDHWLANYAQNKVSPKTYERYSEHIRTHLKPALGHFLIAKLKPVHIQTCYSEALTSGRLDGKGGLSPRTVTHLHRVLRKALQEAVQWELITRNPADDVTPPKVEKKEMILPDDAAIGRLLETAHGTRFYLPTLLVVTTGMRRGEIFGLRWEDIDLEEGLIVVRRSLEQTRGGLRFKSPKSGRARTVVLPDIAVAGLREAKREQDQNRFMLGEGYEENDLVCCRADGSAVVPNTFSGNFQQIVSKAGIGHVRFHDLRHFHATALMGMNIHPKVVSERLGHSSIGITQDLYTHCLPNMQEEAARRIDESLRRVVRGDSSEEG